MRQSRNYLSLLQEHLPQNKFFFLVAYLLEFIPIFFKSTLCSFEISKINIPKNICDYLEYFAYYQMITEKTSDTIIFLLLILISVLLGFFLTYKFLLVSFIKHQNFHRFLIIFYEFFFFRIFSIFIFNIQVKGFLVLSLGYSVFSLILIFFTYIVISLHFLSENMYLNFSKSKIFIFNSTSGIKYDLYSLIIKLLICFSEHLETKATINTFLCFLIIIIHLAFYFGYIYSLSKNKHAFFFNQLLLFAKFYGITLISITSISIIVLTRYIALHLIIILINSLIISFFLTWIMNYLSLTKIFHSGNELFAMLYLINSDATTNAKSYIFHQLIASHKIACSTNDKCKFCTSIKNKNFEDIPMTPETPKEEKNCFLAYEMMCRKYFKHLIKNNPKYKEDSNSESIYYLIELYLSYYSKKHNLIDISTKYHRIKKFYEFSRKSCSLGDAIRPFLPNFLMNLSLIYFEMTRKKTPTESELRNGSLIKVDIVLGHITTYLNQVIEFFSVKITSPPMVIDLAYKLTTLKRRANLKFISSKENRYNYQCIMCLYILETIFNTQVAKSIFISEIIHSFDELLFHRFNEDKIILSLFNLAEETLEIRRCGKELFMLKEKNFSKIFPPFISKEGIQKTFECLKSKNKVQLDYYFFQPDTETAEIIKINFQPLPNMENEDLDYIYILSQYRIVKEKILFFEKKHSKTHEENVLVGISYLASKHLHISPALIKGTQENKTYLKLSDFTTDLVEIDYRKLNKRLTKDGVGLRENTMLSKHKIHLKENISNKYSVYLLEKVHQEMDAKSTKLGMTLKGNQDSEDSELSEFKMNFEAGDSGNSSSCFTKTSLSAYKSHLNEVKNEQDNKFRQFYRFNYLILIFDGIIFVILGIFLGIELSNNSFLNRLFGIITNFNNFQCFFYHSSLSIFSLGCNSDYVEQVNCVNQFTETSKDFIQKHGLGPNDMLSHFVSYELVQKSAFILETLTTWNQDKQEIDSEEISEISSEMFDFYSVSEVSGDVEAVLQYTSFNEATKKYVNIISFLSSSEEYLVSPVFIISIDGYQKNDLSNAVAKKSPIDGQFLNESQRYFYTLLMNFQKYIKKLLRVGDLLSEYFKKKIDRSWIVITVFIILFIIMHFAMLIIVISFAFKYKNIHKYYYRMIYEKVSVDESIKYFKKKVDAVNNLLELYKDNPVNLIDQVDKVKEKETQRKSKVLKEKLRENELKIPAKEGLLNEDVLDQIYNKLLVVRYLLKVIGCFSVYFLISIIFYLVIHGQINKIILMNEYATLNYKVTNYIFINFCLTQLMSLTNQTDNELYYYFQDWTTEIPEDRDFSKEYISENIQDAIVSTKEITRLEKNYKEFRNFSSIIDINCEDLYYTIGDRTTTRTIEAHPEANFKTMLSTYCSTFESLSDYKDDKLSLDVVSYKTAELLHMFSGRDYESLSLMNNSDLLYKLYSDLLLIIRPVRRYIYKYLSSEVIDKMISHYGLLIILFIVFSLVFDLLIFFFLKLIIINQIIDKAKEIINLAVCCECF